MGFDYRASTGRRETDSTLRGHKQNLAHARTQRGGAVAPGRLNQLHLPGLESLLWRCGLQELTAGMGHGQKQSWEVLLGTNPLGGCHEPYYIQPADSRAGSPQAGPLTGRE